MNSFFEMDEKLNYDWFKNLQIFEKIEWLEGFNPDSFSNINSFELKRFFSEIYYCESNAFIRRKAIHSLVTLTLINKVSYDFTKSFLFEDVVTDTDTFILAARLKYIFLLFGDEDVTFETLIQNTNCEESEISSEAYYRLGLINMIYRASSNDSVTRLDFLVEAQGNFNRSVSILENRIDAQFFLNVTQFLKQVIGRQLKSATVFYRKVCETLWKRNIWGWETEKTILENAVFKSLNNLFAMVASLENEIAWSDYKKEFLKLNKYFLDMMAIDGIHNLLLPTMKTLTTLTIQKYLDAYYSFNLSASRLRIDTVISETDIAEKDFLDYLHNLKLQLNRNNSDQRKETTVPAEVSLINMFTNISPEIIQSDIKDLESVGSSEMQILTALTFKYHNLHHESRTAFITGYRRSDEEFQLIKARLNNLLPDLHPMKRAISLDILSDLLRYLYQSLVEKKEFFAPLYTDEPLIESVFQNHLYEKLSSGLRASYYHLEDSGVIGAGRVDIVYRELEYLFPIEVKKNTIKPTLQGIKDDYLAQTQTYAHPYNQLGFLVVFDISSKKGLEPLNDFGSLITIMHLKPFYEELSVRPDYVIVLIIPGNKVSPSSYTNYGKG